MRTETLVLGRAAQLISRRYLQGEVILFADLQQANNATLETLAFMRTHYRKVIHQGPGASAEELLRWLVDSGAEEEPPLSTEVLREEAEPDVTGDAGELARHVVLMARANTLRLLRERDAGVRLLERAMREAGYAAS